ncbi:hypothetical protein NW759_009271 [Fusarium solani]|nr:hypothetical protein NW759_009271 [Fusarium solani]
MSSGTVYHNPADYPKVGESVIFSSLNGVWVITSISGAYCEARSQTPGAGPKMVPLSNITHRLHYTG